MVESHLNMRRERRQERMMFCQPKVEMFLSAKAKMPLLRGTEMNKLLHIGANELNRLEVVQKPFEKRLS